MRNIFGILFVAIMIVTSILISGCCRLTSNSSPISNSEIKALQTECEQAIVGSGLQAAGWEHPSQDYRSFGINTICYTRPGSNPGEFESYSYTSCTFYKPVTNTNPDGTIKSKYNAFFKVNITKDENGNVVVAKCDYILNSQNTHLD